MTTSHADDADAGTQPGNGSAANAHSRTPNPGQGAPRDRRGAIRLRRATPADAAALAGIMGHPQVQPNLMQLPYATEARWRHVLEAGQAPDAQGFILVAERADASGCDASVGPAAADAVAADASGQRARVLGNAGLHPAGPALRRRHAMSLGIAVHPDAQGQGVGAALMGALVDYADRWGQVLRIELTVFHDNARAIALYERFGFRHEGRMVGYALRDGHYTDVLAMARLHPDPPRWG